MIPAEPLPFQRGADGFRLRRHHLPALLGRTPRAAMAEILPLAQVLGRDPLSAFPDLAAVKAASGAAGPPTTAASRSLEDLFLSLVDDRLQALYRAHYAACPPPPDLPHCERIGLLSAVEDQARTLVASVDWRRLSAWLDLERIGESAESGLRRLSAMAFPVRQVNFRFTRHCNIACRHCYNGSGPQRKETRLPLARMLEIVAQMPECGVPRLNLTGGEPFLYVEDVLVLIRAARAAGPCAVSVFTNGFWASTPERARAMLERLRAAGFMDGTGDFLKVSTGLYHQEFVGLERVVLLERTFRETFGRPLRIDCELPEDGSEPAEAARIRLVAAGVDRRADLRFRATRPSGRGRDLTGAGSWPGDTPCPAIDQIAFDADGSVRPCCGFNDGNLGIALSRGGTPALADLIRWQQNDPLLQFLASHPMKDVFQYLDTPASPARHSFSCALCQDAVGGLEDREPLLRRLFPLQRFYPFRFA